MNKYYYVGFYESKNDSFITVGIAARKAIGLLLNKQDFADANDMKTQVYNSANAEAISLYKSILKLEKQNCRTKRKGTTESIFTKDGYELAIDDIRDASKIILKKLSHYRLFCSELEFDPNDVIPINQYLVEVNCLILDQKKQDKLKQKEAEWQKINELTKKLTDISNEISENGNTIIAQSDVRAISTIIDWFRNNMVFEDSAYSQAKASFEDMVDVWDFFMNTYKKGTPNKNAFVESANHCQIVCKKAYAGLLLNGYID